MTLFAPTWFTIKEFEHVSPIEVYHKEQEDKMINNNGMTNLHVLARADFVAQKGMRCVLRISADDYYKLYINGEFVTQGPAPAYPNHYYYNELDISEYLQEGKNVFAVHLYYQGLVNRVWNSGDNRLGIGTQIFCEDSSKELLWRYRISEAYSGDTTGYETQFLENFDSRKWNVNWKELSYEEQGFTPMVVAKWADYSFKKQPTKQIIQYKRLPSKIEKRKNCWLLDMGEEITGTLYIRAKGKAGDMVEILCGEELTGNSDDGSFHVRYEMRCNCEYKEEWILAEGESILEQFDYKAFRYVELIFADTTQIEEVWAAVRHYPMEEVVKLSSSKKELEDIFRICKNGVKYGTQEAYLDCPSREKGQYLGDSIVTAHSQVYLTGSTEMLRKCIEQFAQTSKVCQGLLAVAPGAFMQEIADFSLLWSQLLLLDYKFTADSSFLEKYYLVAKGILSHFSQYEREDGLLCKVADKWNLVDWPENLRDGYDFTLSRPIVADGCHNVVNALYIGAMKTLTEIEDILKLPHTVTWENYLSAFYNVFYNQQTKLFVDSEGSTHSAVHSNVYPLYFGLVAKEQEENIVDFLEKKGLCCGVFLSYFFLKGIAKAGKYDVVYKLLVNETEHGWINMLREGATTCYEAWGREQKWNTSLCHPWASAPIPVMIEDIAGFTPYIDANGALDGAFHPHIPDEVESFCLELQYCGKNYSVKK